MLKGFVFCFLILLSMIALPQNHKILSAKVTYYSKKFDGRKTYSGERFNSNLYTAAHRSFPLQSLVKIVNPKNNKQIIVRINDRFKRKNYIDVTYIAAEKLGVLREGTANVKIQLLDTSYTKEYLSQNFTEVNKIYSKSDTSSFQIDTTEIFYIRIASLKMKKNAEIFINQKLTKEFRSQAFIKKTSFHKKPLYKIMLGPYKSKNEATEVLNIFFKKYKDAVIIGEK